MFEQSIVGEWGAGRNNWTLAVSTTCQVLAVGFVLLLPLLRPDALMVPRLTARLFQPPTPPPPPRLRSVELVKAPSFIVRRARVLYSPTVIPPRPQLIEDPEPFATAVPGAVNSSGAAATDSVIGAIVSHLSQYTPPAPTPAVIPAPKPPAPDTPVLVGGDVQAAKLLHRVIPTYPPLARQMRVSGTVKLQGIIAKDGTIRQLQLLSGHPLLAPAALEAVRQWLYRPTFLNGVPVEVIAPIDVHFTLGN